jgi:hypothetical protein
VLRLASAQVARSGWGISAPLICVQGGAEGHFEREKLRMQLHPMISVMRAVAHFARPRWIGIWQRLGQIKAAIVIRIVRMLSAGESQ